MMKFNLKFIFLVSLFYCVLSASFSLIGLILPEKTTQINPISSLSFKEVVGHMIWGLIVGAASLSLRYFLLGGIFALFIDADHLIGLTHLDALSRMSHSIIFGIVSVTFLMFLFGKK